MMTGTSGRSALALGKSSIPLIPGMLMSERIKMSDTPAASGDALERHWGRLGKLHREAARAKVAPKLLAEQNLHIGLIINHENKRVHMRSPDLIRDTPARGRTILNSVKLPGCVSTSIDPPCCLTTMS